MSIFKLLLALPAGYVLLLFILAIAMAIAFRSLRPLLWPLHELVGVALWLIGWPICCWLVTRRRYEYRFEPLFARQLLEWSPSWAFLWANNEDGIDGLRGNLFSNGEWREHTKGWSAWRRILVWSAWRNPVGNLRFVRPFGFFIDPARVRSIATPRGYLAWCGPYCGVRLTIAGITALVGWKIRPQDSQGLVDDDYRRKGCGFAFQLART